MKRLILSAALLIASAGCSTNSQPADKIASAPTATAAPTTQASAKAINKYCAVDREDEVDPAVTYLYQGKVIGFCCEDCVPKFKKDPEKYMKVLK
jgi:YHS domain-containing protein